jgi:hypothetical protein
LSLRNVIGVEGYQMLTGLTTEQEEARVKAWSIALDSQLAGGDDEVCQSRLVLTFLASRTLPDTPYKLMLEALHARVLLLDLSKHNRIVRAIASSIASTRWSAARQLNQIFVEARGECTTKQEDELTDHLAALVEQDCDTILTPDIVQRAHNLAFNKDTAHDIASQIDGMDAVVGDSTISSPLDAVAAWSSTLALNRILSASLAGDDIELEALKANIDLAANSAPFGSVARARACIARAVLVDERRGESIALASEALRALEPDEIPTPLAEPTPSQRPFATGVEVDLELSLRCAIAMAHLSRASTLIEIPAKSLRHVDGVIKASNASSLSLLRCTAAMKMMQAYFHRPSAPKVLGSSLEKLAGNLRLWMGGPNGSTCGVSTRAQHAVVGQCLSMTKNLVGMEVDTGYGSMSEDEGETACT